MIEETFIGGVPLPKGTFIDCQWLDVFSNEQIYEDPHEFIPERWEREDYKEKKQIISLGFSAGPRSCIGKNLALMEMKIMTIKLLMRYEKVI